MDPHSLRLPRRAYSAEVAHRLRRLETAFDFEGQAAVPPLQSSVTPRRAYSAEAACRLPAEVGGSNSSTTAEHMPHLIFQRGSIEPAESFSSRIYCIYGWTRHDQAGLWSPTAFAYSAEVAHRLRRQETVRLRRPSSRGFLRRRVEAQDHRPHEFPSVVRDSLQTMQSNVTALPRSDPLPLLQSPQARDLTFLSWSTGGDHTF